MKGGWRKGFCYTQPGNGYSVDIEPNEIYMYVSVPISGIIYRETDNIMFRSTHLK